MFGKKFCYLLILLICTYSQIVNAYSYQKRDFYDDICTLRTAKNFNPNIDLTAQVTNFSVNYTKDYSEFAENTYRQADELIELGSMCAHGPADQSRIACDKIVNSAISWANNSYLIAEGEYDTNEWWEESNLSNKFMNSMLETFFVADAKVNQVISQNKNIRAWILEAIQKNRKYEVAQNNHRTLWVVTAMKSSRFLNEKIRVGSNKKTFVEIGDWELNFQFHKMMNKDGAFEKEATRGTRALFYTGRQIGNLLSILEMMEASGNGRYEKFRNKLHIAVGFFLNAVDDPEIIFPYAKKMWMSPDGNPLNQDYGKNSGEKRATFSFLKIYASRFPNHQNTERIMNQKLLSKYIKEDINILDAFGVDAGCLKPKPKLKYFNQTSSGEASAKKPNTDINIWPSVRKLKQK